MAERRLNPRQEKFCQCIADGMGVLESYRASYQNNTSDKSASVRASQMMAMASIQARIKELQRPIVEGLQARAISETEKIKDLLWERIEICRTTGDEAAIARYTDQLNKLNNAYKDTKPLGEDETAAFKDMDTESILKIVGQ